MTFIDGAERRGMRKMLCEICIGQSHLASTTEAKSYDCASCDPRDKSGPGYLPRLSNHALTAFENEEARALSDKGADVGF
jgi:hypothetical protein